MNWLKRIILHYIPPIFKKNREAYRKAQLLVSASWISILFLMSYIPIYLLVGYYWAVWICLYGLASILLVLYIFYNTKKLRLASNLLCFTSNIFFVAFILTSGGMFSPLVPWLITVPTLAFLVSNRRLTGYYWSVICTLEIVVLYVLSLYDIHFKVLFPLAWFETIHFIAFFGLILYMIVMIWAQEQTRDIAMQQLRKAKDQISRKNKELEAKRKYIEQKNKEISVQNNLLEIQNEKMISLNNQLEQTVYERTEKLSRINDELGAFLYRASHDLRRPIMSIVGLLDLMKMEEGNQENIELFGKLSFTVNNMDKMLKKLIMVSDIHHETSALVKIEFEQIIQKILDQLQSMIQEKNIQFSYEINTPVEFYSSASSIESVLFNLIENAIVFNDFDKPISEVQVKIYQQQKQVILEVKDNGIGIPEEIKNKVFRMFYKGTTRSTGNGLGLHIVKKAAEKLEAKIQLQSEEREGTFIRLTFANPFE